MNAALCYDSLRSVAQQRQRRTFAVWATTLAFFVTAMTASVNVMASPEAKAILKTKACGSCHIIPGVEGAYGKVGPTLRGLNQRVRIVAGTRLNNTKNLKAWLKNPKSIKSGTMMPNMGLSDDEIEIVIKYLSTL